MKIELALPVLIILAFNAAISGLLIQANNIFMFNTSNFFIIFGAGLFISSVWQNISDKTGFTSKFTLALLECERIYRNKYQ